MYFRDQIPTENYNVGDRIRGYVTEVRNTTNAPQIVMSRTSSEFMRKLFEMEVPEIAEGTVSIVACAREPGARAKIAVNSRDANVDPVGACVGMKGSRVQAVVNELRGEKIDIVPYSENPATFVCNGLAPAEITKVIIDEDNRKMDIVVADDQLSLAIGKRGQNVRLAVQLTNWKLDIHSESQIKQIEAQARKMYKRLTKVPEGQREILIKTGYTTIEDLAEAEIEDLANFPGIDETLAEEIIDEAYTIKVTGEWPLPEPEDEEEDLGAEEDLTQEEALAAAEVCSAKPKSPRPLPKPNRKSGHRIARRGRFRGRSRIAARHRRQDRAIPQRPRFQHAQCDPTRFDRHPLPGARHGMALAEDLKEAVLSMEKPEPEEKENRRMSRWNPPAKSRRKENKHHHGPDRTVSTVRRLSHAAPASGNASLVARAGRSRVPLA
jgi:N utilization substance protein A